MNVGGYKHSVHANIVGDELLQGLGCLISDLPRSAECSKLREQLRALAFPSDAFVERALQCNVQESMPRSHLVYKRCKGK